MKIEDIKYIENEKYRLPLFTKTEKKEIRDVKLECEKYWAMLETKGENINIAIIDTGVDKNHENIKGKVLRSMNFASDLKVCLETLNLKDTERFDYFLRVLLYCYSNKGKFDSYFKTYYDILKSFGNFFENKYEDYSKVYNYSENVFNNIISELKDLYNSKVVFKDSRNVDITKTYEKYLEKFAYNGIFYYYELNDGNPCLETHGTHVASICSGKKNNLYTGVAPDSNIYDLCVQSKAIESGLFFIQDALRWIDSHGKDYNISIINMSLGSSKPWGETETIIQSIIHKGMYIVAATGNSQEIESKDDSMFISYPSGYPDVISIGSVGKEEDSKIDYTKKSDFSEIGENIDLVAPGKNIIGALSRSLNNTVVLSGTSMACPYASGIIALLLSYFEKNSLNIKEPKIKRLNWLLANMTKENQFNKNTGFGKIEIDFECVYTSKNKIDLISEFLDKMPSQWKLEKTRVI